MQKAADAKIRVAFIVPGGIGTGHHNMGVPVLAEFVTGMATAADVTVFSLFKINEDYTPSGFKVVSIPDSNNIIKSLKLLWHLWRHRKEPFDVIHGFWVLPSGLLSVVIGKFFGIRSVVGILGGDAASLPLIQYGQLRTHIQRALVLWTLHHADECIALTHYSVGSLKHFGLKKAVNVIPWGVDRNRFVLKEKTQRACLEFLHVANLISVKDQTTLLKAFSLICQQIPSRLTIIGEGPDEMKLRALAKILGLKETIRFLGLQPYAHVPSFYHQSDILLQSSLSEGQGQAVTEAMACGVVVCGTRVGLMADYPELFVTVEPGDYVALAKEVVLLVRDESRIEKLRRNAFDWVVAHSIHRSVELTMDLYRT